jgi:hypothetical protein
MAEVQPQQQEKSQQPAAENSTLSIKDKEGNWVPDWQRKVFSDNFNTQNYDRVKRFKNPEEMATSYVALENKLNSTGRMPKDDSSAEDWETFHKSWGRPDKAEGYTIPETIAKEVKETFNPEFTSSLNGLAHKLGLNQKQYAGLVEWGSQQAGTQMQAAATQKEAGFTELKKEWGSDYTARTNLAAATIKSLCGTADHPFVRYLDETKMGDDPRFIKFFYDLGKEMGEDEILSGKEDQDVKVEDAKTKIGEIRADKAHPFNNPKHPNHKKAVEEVAGLYALVNGVGQ